MTAAHEYRVALLAAGLLLAGWAVRGARSVRLEGGRVWPEELAPKHVSPAWPITAPEAQEMLVASVALGERYREWPTALATARRALAETPT